MPADRTAGAIWCPGGGRRLRADRAVLRRDQGRARPARRAGGLLRQSRAPGERRPLPAHGRLAVRVVDPESALGALEEIVEQGEGITHAGIWDGDQGESQALDGVGDGDQDVFHPEREEVAHYHRFQELKLGRRCRRGDTPRSGPTGDALPVDLNGVLPMRRNPRSADHAPGSAVRTAQEEFRQHLLHPPEPARRNLQRRPGPARGRHRHHVHAQGPGPGPDADARRGRHHGRPRLRIRAAGAAASGPGSGADGSTGHR
ncbi:ferritin-like domain-containing protein [Nonomuraea sp. NPDC050153]|uniref:ferritin-like domain-containing protein n=1 Tax=Nonomuraea sp. NPDC050153 TaxID=3364359 RepID=UPI0037AD9A6E